MARGYRSDVDQRIASGRPMASATGQDRLSARLAANARNSAASLDARSALRCIKVALKSMSSSVSRSRGTNTGFEFARPRSPRISVVKHAAELAKQFDRLSPGLRIIWHRLFPRSIALPWTICRHEMSATDRRLLTSARRV